jgi:micrococcal nuclease
MIGRAGNQVYLEQDVSETDRYGRLLRYVWLPHDDGTRMLNQELVAHGYAQSSTYPPDVKYQHLFVEAQQQARNEGRGLWGSCGDFGVPLATPTPVPTPPPASGNCDPSYPDFCLEPGIPDLDCGDIPYGRFTVLPPDPHGFDGNDNDGLGCESN